MKPVRVELHEQHKAPVGHGVWPPYLVSAVDRGSTDWNDHMYVYKNDAFGVGITCRHKELTKLSTTLLYMLQRPEVHVGCSNSV